MSSSAHYRRHSSLAGPVQVNESNNSQQELPPYSRYVEHAYHLMNKNKPWATLKLLSSAKSEQHIPMYYQRERITGSLELNLEKDDIMAVTVTVTGRMILGAGSTDFITFFENSLTLWSKSSAPASSNNGKLSGTHNWPISIELPKSVSLDGPQGEGKKSYRLPQTFVEKQTRASLQYNITVHINRSKLRADSQLTTQFAFIPHTVPEPLTLLRQIAYQENALLPGPEADPNGWITSDEIIARGVMNTTRYVVVKCKISLAKPLCYTRGTAIPCILDMECDDRVALDLLSATTSATVKLQRRLRYFIPTNSACNKTQVGWNETVEDVASAVWWPSVEGGRKCERDSRRIDGEIRLPKEIKPSTSISHFSIGYEVILCPFEAVTYKAADTQPMFATPVEIATKHAKGPKARPFSPPGYDAAARKPQECRVVLETEPYVIRT